MQEPNKIKSSLSPVQSILNGLWEALLLSECRWGRRAMPTRGRTCQKAMQVVEGVCISWCWRDCVIVRSRAVSRLEIQKVRKLSTPVMEDGLDLRLVVPALLSTQSLAQVVSSSVAAPLRTILTAKLL